MLLYCCCASDCSVASATSASCKHEAKHIGNQSNLMELVSAHVSILHFPSAEGTSFQMPPPQLIINSISKYLQITCHPTHCEVRVLTSNTAISRIFNILPETLARSYKHFLSALDILPTTFADPIAEPRPPIAWHSHQQ